VPDLSSLVTGFAARTGRRKVASASAEEATAAARDYGVPRSRLRGRAAQVRDTAQWVPPEEFRWQESHYDIDSRRGRELLFLIAHHEWVRATSEIVNVRRSDAVDTTISIDIDLDQITHEEYRGRTGRLWLPVMVLPPRLDEHDANALRPNRPESESFTMVTDASGGLLATLPQADVRHQVSAAVAEIIVNVAVARWPGLDDQRPTATRDMRLLLSAAIYRLLRREPAVHSGAVRRADGPSSQDGSRSPSRQDRAEPPRIKRAKDQLDNLLKSYEDLLLGKKPSSDGNHADESGDRRNQAASAPAGSAADDREPPPQFAPELVLRAVMVLEALAQSAVVVVPVDRASAPTVLTVRVPTRRLCPDRTRSLFHPLILQPRANLQIDLLLPSAEADRQVQLQLPEGVSLAESRMAGDAHTPPVSMSIKVGRPQPLKDLAVLMKLITEPLSPGRPAELQECLADLARAKAGAVRETLRQYWDGPAPGLARDPDGGEPWRELRALQAELDKFPAVAAGSEDTLSDLRAAWTAFKPLMYKLLRRTWTDSPGTRTVVARADMIEDVAQRAVPTCARLHVDVSVDDAEYLSVARFSGIMSMLAITAVLAFFSAARLLKLDITPSSEVLAIVLTLFSAVQAGRIERADRSTLRGLLSAVGDWLILASVLPAVILAIALTFFPTRMGPVIWAGICTILQLTALIAMWRGPLAATGSPGRAQRRFSTRQPNYYFSEALRSDWWRSTTADALMIGRKAHAYVVWQEGTAPPLAQLLTHARKAGPPAAGGESSAKANSERPQADGRVPTTGGPASVLALLRSGTIGQEATFVAFREEPVSGWAAPAEAKEVPLDPDRLSPRDSVASNIDIYVGVSRACRLPIAKHPLVKILTAANHLLIVLEAQLPVPPPVAGYTDWHWGRVRMALRDDQDIRRLDEYLGIIRSKEVVGNEPQHITAVQLVPEAGPRIIVRPAVSVGSDLPSVPSSEMDAGAADGCDGSSIGHKQQSAAAQEGSDANPIPPVAPPVLASDMDFVNTAANGDESDVDFTWRVLVICADARSNIESDIVCRLHKTWPDLEPVALTFGIMYGTAVVLLLGHEPGESSQRHADLQSEPGSGPAAQRLNVPVNVQRSRRQLGKAEEHPLLRVHVRSPDRPGELLNVLDSLDKALNERIPTLKAAGGWQVWHAQTHVTTGQAALTRMTVRLSTQAADVAKWAPSMIEEIERKIRLMAACETAAAHDSDGSSGPEPFGAEDPVISVNVIRMPAR
jgi:hypothetical protein